MEYMKRISANPEIMFGKPVIKGTRITVEFILEQLAEGATFEEITSDYPGLSAEDIRACLAYSADVISRDVLIAG
jgi:uncharacterized protein (DUF433 family)